MNLLFLPLFGPGLEEPPALEVLDIPKAEYLLHQALLKEFIKVTIPLAQFPHRSVPEEWVPVVVLLDHLPPWMPSKSATPLPKQAPH